MKKHITLKTFVEGRGYSRQEWDELDCPDATDEELAQARPFKEAFPEIHAAIMQEINKTEPSQFDAQSKFSAAA